MKIKKDFQTAYVDIMARHGMPPIVGSSGTILDSNANLTESYLQLIESEKISEKGKKSEDYKALRKAHYTYQIWRYKYQKRVFNSQLIFSWLFSLGIIALIAAGIIFSFIQLTYSLKLNDLQSLESNINVSGLKDISFRSSVIGAIVLIISIVFFFIYLRYMFKIQYPIPPFIGFDNKEQENPTETDKNT